MMSVPWTDKRGITHAWLVFNTRGDNGHAGWYTARAPCGAQRRFRHGMKESRAKSKEVNCMACVAASVNL